MKYNKRKKESILFILDMHDCNHLQVVNYPLIRCVASTVHLQKDNCQDKGLVSTHMHHKQGLRAMSHGLDGLRLGSQGLVQGLDMGQV